MAEMLSGWEIASALLKALTYAAALGAAGGALFLVIFRALIADERRRVESFTAAIALLGAGLSALAIPWQAGSLSGERFAGMFDPLFLELLIGSAFGASVLLRLLGLGLVAALLLHRPAAYWSAALGALLVIASFAMTGHTASFEPRLLGGGLVALHLLAVAFWIGALWPLLLVSRASDTARAAGILERFGTIAIALVGALVVAGGLLAWLFLGGLGALWETTYGNLFALKLVLFAGLLTLAALNRLRLVPDLAAGAPKAGRALRRSIALEMAAVAFILSTTAALTTFSSPF